MPSLFAVDGFAAIQCSLWTCPAGDNGDAAILEDILHCLEWACSVVAFLELEYRCRLCLLLGENLPITPAAVLYSGVVVLETTPVPAVVAITMPYIPLLLYHWYSRVIFHCGSPYTLLLPYHAVLWRCRCFRTYFPRYNIYDCCRRYAGGMCWKHYLHFLLPANMNIMRLINYPFAVFML